MDVRKHVRKCLYFYTDTDIHNFWTPLLFSFSPLFLLFFSPPSLLKTFKPLLPWSHPRQGHDDHPPFFLSHLSISYLYICTIIITVMYCSLAGIALPAMAAHLLCSSPAVVSSLPPFFCSQGCQHTSYSFLVCFEIQMFTRPWECE